MIENFKGNMLTERDVDELKLLVKPYLTDKRYSHTLCVAEEAERLGEIFLPSRITELKIAALLHDITKKADFEKQLHYCEIFGIINDAHHNISPDVLHSKTAAELAKRDFAHYVNEDILNAVRYHTTGRYGMSVFEGIIYLADYIEPSRVHNSCKTVRKEFYDRISRENDKLAVLYDTIICTLDMTIQYLTDKNAVIDADTINARDYYLKLKTEASELKCEDNNE